MKRILFVLFLLSSLVAFSQTGTIRGTVIADANGETLIGVNILVKNTTTGTITDLDGQFTLQLAPGSYDLQISYITYQTTTISDVVVKANDVTLLENIRLAESNLQLGEVVITAEAVRTSEVALLSMKKKSASIMDGISASKMRLTGDATAVEAAKRVTGVSIEDGKYIYIRGLGDRYTKTTLNNVDIPGLDPDRNSLQMDIFPTNLIDNIVVSKNFTAELPADFTGGIVNVETKAFPEAKILSVSLGTSYNPSMNLNKDYLTYNGGKTDFLGFDDGSRKIPQRAANNQIPRPFSAPDEEVTDFVQRFNPQLGAKRQLSPLDYNASFTLGNQIELKKRRDSSTTFLNSDPKLGYILSLSYKADYKYYDDMIIGEYQRQLDPDAYELRYATVQEGQLGEQNILLGGLGGLAYKTNRSKYRLTLMRLQSGTSRAGQFNIDNDGAAVGQSGYFASSDNLEYNQRSMTNLLLNGTHVSAGSKWEIDWRLSPTISTSEDPDIRKTAFTETAVDTSFIAGAGGNPVRIWRTLEELNATGKIDVTRNYKYKNRDAKLKFGVSQIYKERDYEILSFDMQFVGSQEWESPDPNIVLNPENIFRGDGSNAYYVSGNNTPNPNAYNSNNHNTGIYISNEMNLTPALKTIVGVRAERFIQRHTGRDQGWSQGNIEGNNLVNDDVLNSFDFFPSLNLIYALNEQQNLRLAYGRTIARPSFKELSYAQILDPITNRIFNGGLYEYLPDWDGNLTETRVDNLDLRWELFQERGQLFSVSGFYKQFDDPIELVRIPTQQTSTEYQPRNVGDGRLFGVELEIRKDLAFISPSLEKFNMNGNVTFVYSEIEMTEVEFNSRKTFEKTGENIDNIRQMAGQSPYVINGGVGYSNPDLGLETGLFYNVKGPTLFIVGAGLFPDVYTNPFHSFNFSINKKLGKEGKTMIDFKVSNILDDQMETVYKAYKAQDQPFTVFSPGRAFSIGVSHNF